MACLRIFFSTCTQRRSRTVPPAPQPRRTRPRNPHCTRRHPLAGISLRQARQIGFRSRYDSDPIMDRAPVPPFSLFQVESCAQPEDVLIAAVLSIKLLPNSLRRDFNQVRATLLRHVNTAYIPERQKECLNGSIAV